MRPTFASDAEDTRTRRSAYRGKLVKQAAAIRSKRKCLKIQPPILHSLGNMLDFNIAHPFQVGNAA